MSHLRSKVIRLAHARPELRSHLLPLLKQASEAPKITEIYAYHHNDSEYPGVVVHIEGLSNSDGEILVKALKKTFRKADCVWDDTLEISPSGDRESFADSEYADWAKKVPQVRILIETWVKENAYRWHD